MRKPIEMEPIGTVPDIDRGPIVENTDSGVTTPNSGTPGQEGACSGGRFDDLLEALSHCEVDMPKGDELPADMKKKLDVRVTVSTPTIIPGGRVDLEVTLRNKSKESLPLFFSGDPAPRFEVHALDKRGRRVDIPRGKQPKYPKGYKRPTREAQASRITLTPGGRARLKLVWDAVKMKWAPKKLESWDGPGYPHVPAGPLRKGKYKLRVQVPLIGVSDEGGLDVPKVPIVVGS